MKLVLHRVVSAEINANPVSFKGLESAKAVVTVLVDSLVPTGYMRFAPDSAIITPSFALTNNAHLYRLFHDCRVRVGIHAGGKSSPLLGP